MHLRPKYQIEIDRTAAAWFAFVRIRRGARVVWDCVGATSRRTLRARLARLRYVRRGERLRWPQARPASVERAA